MPWDYKKVSIVTDGYYPELRRFFILEFIAVMIEMRGGLEFFDSL